MYNFRSFLLYIRQTRLHLTMGAHQLTTLTDAHSGLQAGDVVRVSPEAPLYFNDKGNRI